MTGVEFLIAPLNPSGLRRNAVQKAKSVDLSDRKENLFTTESVCQPQMGELNSILSSLLSPCPGGLGQSVR